MPAITGQLTFKPHFSNCIRILTFSGRFSANKNAGVSALAADWLGQWTEEVMKSSLPIFFYQCWTV